MLRISIHYSLLISVTSDYIIFTVVSIGRRLQDPLLELYKIEPKHIGVGMYQVALQLW